MATDLYTLLKETGHPGPYILVGHSMAGLILRSFVDKYPNEVAGVIFVDASHPLQYERFEQYPALKMPKPPKELLVRFVCNVGYMRLTTKKTDCYPSTKPSTPINKIQHAFLPMSLPSVYEEMRAFETLTSEAKQAKGFGSIPFTVITGTSKSRETEDGLDPKVGRAFMNIWMDLQKNYLSLSTNSKHILAPNSGHYVQLDEPQIVVEAVREMVNKIK